VSLVLTPHQTTKLFDPFSAWHSSREQWLAAGVNRLLKQQPWASTLLAQHPGRTFQITWLYSELAFSITETGQLMPATAAAIPDVVVHIPETIPALVLKKLLSSKQDLQANLKVSGDASLAQTLSLLARDLRPDFEDALATTMGDIPASRLLGGLRKTAEAIKTSFGNTQQNIAEYLTYETQTLTDRESYLLFSNAMTTLRSRLDQLSSGQLGLDVRVQKLNSQRNRLAK